MGCLSLFVQVGQIGSVIGPIKTYVTIGFIMNLDLLFGAVLPTSTKALANNINGKGGLKIPKDLNTLKLSTGRLWKAFHFRFFRRQKDEWTVAWIRKQYAKCFAIMKNELVNLCIIAICSFIANFQVLIYNYLMAFFVLVVQLGGFVLQHKHI